MGAILGLGVTHYPGLHAHDQDMANLLRRTLSRKSVPEQAKDPRNWPAGMRAEWAEDGGAAAARIHRERCFAAFRTVRAKLDRFRPDFVLIFGDDQYENFVEDIVPPFCLYILDQIESRPFETQADEPPEPPNIWQDAPSTIFRHRGHAQGARFIANRLCDEAMIASSSWSHAFLTRKNDWIYPDHASDRARLEELREGRLDRWRDLTREQLEDAGQHELLNWVALAGAMSEPRRQAEVVDYVETYVLNSNKCFAAWA